MQHFQKIVQHAAIWALAVLLLAGLSSAQTGLAQQVLSPQALAEPASSAKLKIALAGDSTVTDQSGWGQGFAELLNEKAECTNLAQSGRSSRSYRDEGWWSKCLEARPDYLLIQFGHNDQPGKGPQRESDAKTDFRDHLRAYVKEARELGIKPVLVTSLTRRRWNADGKIEPTLAEYAEATRIVAVELDVPLVDLHQLSIQQCEQIGPTAYRAFEPMDVKGADHTHLNLEGSRAVAPLVARGLREAVPALASVFDETKIQQYTVPKNRSSSLTSGRLKLDEAAATIEIRLADKPLLTYNIVSPPVPEGIDSVYQRSGFLHPVVSPSGLVVTETFPFDHAHQHGIFSAWVMTKWQDREIDFWNLAKRTGRVMHQRVVSSFAEQGRIGFEVDLIHRAEADPIVDILRERWKITAWETDGSFHQFDLETTQSALTDIPLKIEKYHYGGVAYRGPVRWLSGKEPTGEQTNAREEPSKQSGDKSVKREPFEFRNDQGADRIQGNSQHTRWVVASGQIDGRLVSITVLCHEGNFRAPQAARLHHSKPYFAFSPCVDDAFTIDRQSEYKASYRYLVTDSMPDTKWIDEQWNGWHGK